jgi:hypothetical protein
MNDRCYLASAVAPRATSARAANDALNDYVGDRRRGVPAFHDHFTRVPHGGIAVFHVRSDDELAALAEPGPLAGWTLAVHALTFSLTAVGFSAQTEFTVEAYAQTSLAALRAAEHDDPRYWWRRRRMRSGGQKIAHPPECTSSTRHLRRMRILYRCRRDALVDALAQALREAARDRCGLPLRAESKSGRWADAYRGRRR